MALEIATSTFEFLFLIQKAKLNLRILIKFLPHNLQVVTMLNSDYKVYVACGEFVHLGVCMHLLCLEYYRLWDKCR